MESYGIIISCHIIIKFNLKAEVTFLSNIVYIVLMFKSCKEFFFVYKNAKKPCCL